MEILQTLQRVWLVTLTVMLCSWYTASAQNDLSLTQTVDKPTATSGETVTFTITIHNDNGTEVGNVEVTNTAPAGLDNVTYNTATGSVTGGVWSIGTIDAATTSVEMTVRGTVAGEGVLYNLA